MKKEIPKYPAKNSVTFNGTYKDYILLPWKWIIGNLSGIGHLLLGLAAIYTAYNASGTVDNILKIRTIVTVMEDTFKHQKTTTIIEIALRKQELGGYELMHKNQPEHAHVPYEHKTLFNMSDESIDDILKSVSSEQKISQSPVYLPEEKRAEARELLKESTSKEDAIDKLSKLLIVRDKNK